MSHAPGPMELKPYVITYNRDLNAFTLDDQQFYLSAESAAMFERLFEAAPDLLAACKELLLVAGTYKPIDMYDWERVSAVIDQAKAALKKARGES